MPASAGADTLVAPSGEVKWLGGGDQGLVWVHSLSKVATTAGGSVASLPIRNTDRDTSIELGTSASGSIQAVYSSRRSSRVCKTGVCGLYTYDFRSKRSTKVPGVHRNRCVEDWPSLWKGNLVFSRAGARCSTGVYMRRSNGRIVRVTNRLTIGTDIDRGLIAYVALPGRPGRRSGRTELRLQRVSSRRSCLVWAESRSNGRSINDVVVVRNRVYWSFSNSRTERDGLARASGCRQRGARKPPGLQFSRRSFAWLQLLSFAADNKGRIFYGAKNGVRRADAPTPF